MSPSAQKILSKPFMKKVFLLVGRAGEAVGSRLKKPVFVVGTGRCGTTLLAEIFSSHPELFMHPREANHLWHPALYPHKNTRVDNAKPIEFDPEKFTQMSFENWPENHADTIRRMFLGRHILSGRSKVFILKSSMLSFMISDLLKIFPDARFIHLYRNGPPVVESYLKKSYKKYPELARDEDEYRTFCATYWNKCIMEIERVSHEFSLREEGRWFEFSYESLCQNPEESLAELSRYLGVDAGKFSYDFSQINNRNFKVGDYRKEEKWASLLQIMYPGMKLKGYID